MKREWSCFCALFLNGLYPSFTPGQSRLHAGPDGCVTGLTAHSSITGVPAKVFVYCRPAGEQFIGTSNVPFYPVRYWKYFSSAGVQNHCH